MSHAKITLVKILRNDDGVEIPKEEQVWHLSIRWADAPRTFCGGEAYGEGESRVVYEEKIVHRGITCPHCRNYIEYIKKVAL